MTRCSYTFDPAQRSDSVLEASWECPHEAHVEANRCIYHMSPEERSKHDITPARIVEGIRENLDTADPQLNEYVGAQLPLLNFSFNSVSGTNNRQLNFRYATIEGIDLQDSALEQGIDLSYATVGRISADEATIQGEVIAHDATIEGSVTAEQSTIERDWELTETDIEGDVVLDDATFDGKLIGDGAEIGGEFRAEEVRFGHDCQFVDATFGDRVVAVETIFQRNATFREAAFEAHSEFHETTFDDEARFQHATFEKDAEFQATEFSGKSHAIDDNAAFTGVTFHARVCFRQARFGAVTFDDATFHGEAIYDHTRIEGNAHFHDTVFHGRAVFLEARFTQDAEFTNSQFHEQLTFKGATFRGGSRAANDDVSFAEVVFGGPVIYDVAEFRYANFTRASFEDIAQFEETRFNGDADFVGVTFADEADFDESRFHGDANFEDSNFHGPAMFRGAEFEGEAKHLEDNAQFDDVTFHQNAEFDSASFRTASFRHAVFAAKIDFSGSVFKERADFLVESDGSDTYVNFTEAEIYGGTIELHAGNIVPYDFTRATLGDVSLAGETEVNELLDYFRFCETDFDGFDFSNHHAYLERNGWQIHTFDANDAGIDPSVEMDNRSIEITYLKAQNSAQEVGDKSAASEFEVKRNRYNRKKNWSIVRDGASTLNGYAKLKKVISVSVNWFMDKSCGYGNRIPRVVLLTLFVPLVYSLFYMMGGIFAIKNADGGVVNVWNGNNLAEDIGNAVYFSYISFTTIGYGNVAPFGAGARFLAATQGLRNGVFFALLIYTLNKQTDF
jgi:uncharacterized protein YjbI with pentapeptide repeats